MQSDDSEGHYLPLNTPLPSRKVVSLPTLVDNDIVSPLLTTPPDQNEVPISQLQGGVL